MLKMKRGKDEDKTMGPMFPRLHVNEIEKRGPRAPPRNKMALYEQLSIPSQRFTGTVDVVPNSSQGGGSEKDIFVSRQLMPRHQSEKQYSQFSDSSAPVAQVDQRKELDDDDFRVPIFIHSKSNVEHGVSMNVTIAEKPSPSNSSYLNPLFKFRKANTQKEEKLKELAADPDKAISNSSSLCQETVVNSLDSIERLKSGGCVRLEVCPELQPVSNMHDSAACGMRISTMDKRRSSVIARDLSYGAEVTEPNKDQPRVDTLSETSITDTISGLEITPDDVVGVLGQKRFWKARRAIVNQQRAFADQVFELHRLVKVQKSIASLPHFLLEDVVHISKPVKVLTEKIGPLDCPNKALPNVSNPKGDPKSLVTEEGSAENSNVKSAVSSVQNNSLPPHYGIACNQTRPWCFNQPHGPQWLVPVMSPSEGLVYKPYPGPSYVCPPVPSNNFMTSAYGVPAIHPQYQFPSFPAPGSHSYFPAYGMPVISTASFSSSSVEQVNQPSVPGQSQLANLPSQRNKSGPGQENLQLSEDIEVQASTGSSQSEKAMGSGSGSVLDKRNALRLFPTSPTEPECPTPARVIKVVPHKAGSATESVARIFRSIQEERKHYDSL